MPFRGITTLTVTDYSNNTSVRNHGNLAEQNRRGKLQKYKKS